MIAAPKSGSGKTVVTCALLQVLKDYGLNVAAYKCGPDYIDPMFMKDNRCSGKKIWIHFLQMKKRQGNFFKKV